MSYYKEMKGAEITGILCLHFAPINTDVYSYFKISQTEYNAILSDFAEKMKED